MIIFRGFANRRWFYGGYLKHQKFQPSPMGDSIKDEEENIQPVIVFDGFADWNMPRAIKCAEVEKGSVGISYDDQDKNKQRIFSDDIVLINEKIGIVISTKEGLAVVDLKNKCSKLSDVLIKNSVEIIDNICELKREEEKEKILELIKIKENYDIVL